MAVLLAAQMSTLSAMINVTSSVVLNDFLKRYFARQFPEKKLVRLGQLASIGSILLGFLFSLGFRDVVSAWETMIFVIVTMILVPATMELLGEANWWLPGWLDRILPNVHLEAPPVAPLPLSGGAPAGGK